MTCKYVQLISKKCSQVLQMTTFIQKIKSTSALVVFLGGYNQLMQYKNSCLTFSILLSIKVYDGK